MSVNSTQIKDIVVDDDNDNNNGVDNGSIGLLLYTIIYVILTQMFTRLPKINEEEYIHASLF